MDYFQYHSGTGDTFIGELPSSDDILPQFAARAILASPKALLKIRIETNQYAPNHTVTLRNTILGSLGIPHDPNEGLGYSNEGIVHHASGTMRMSDDGSGVVDTNLQFKTYDNLYCAVP